MVQNQIRSLFLLFAGEEELPDAVQPVLDEAVLEVQQALKDGADAAQKLEFAGLLVQAYRRLCRSLLEDETFLFQTV